MSMPTAVKSPMYLNLATNSQASSDRVCFPSQALHGIYHSDSTTKYNESQNSSQGGNAARHVLPLDVIKIRLAFITASYKHSSHTGPWACATIREKSWSKGMNAKHHKFVINRKEAKYDYCSGKLGLRWTLTYRLTGPVAARTPVQKYGTSRGKAESDYHT